MEMDLRVMGSKDVDWVKLSVVKVWLQSLVSIIMNT
jgi:hypothetical protein